ncbi:MAG TPA: urate hydroxylase PuuD [Thermoanaerobaculia bacterium]|nr:urate hydroxylase PuuD [Thermoanaerobaculia bacterium]
MDYKIYELLNLIIRWIHVFAGILWIGQTYLFTWLDVTLNDPDEKGQVWMVHSGGFYVVEKQKKPELARTLHWFRWEAAITWLSGFALFVVVYYLGGLLVDSGSSISPGMGIAISIGLVVLGWLIYDALWSSPIGKNYTVGAVISYILLVALGYGCTRIFSTRAAYLEVGAVMGTLMAANVWVRILPAQRRLIAAVMEGKEPDERLANQAKTRSKHNTFMVVPLVLIMLSNHFPVTTYGNKYNWLVLAGIILVGWGAAKVIRSR